MDKVMNEPLEQRVKILELKIQFLESWKSSSFVQVTLPVIVSLALASTWANTAVTMMRDDINSLKTDMKTFEAKVDQRFNKIDQKFNAIDQKFNAIDQRLSRIDKKLGI